MKALLHKYRHAWVYLYAFIYFPWFIYLEKHVTRGYDIIQTAADKKIPFIEYFIIPYFLWFLFIAGTNLYFFFTNRTEFYRTSAFMIVGMTAFLIISTIYPNGQALRPRNLSGDGIFIELVRYLYRTDTPTNVFPSIHVYNSIGSYLAIRKSKRLKESTWVQTGAFILTILIILSTMFLKQHSIIDVIGAFVLAVPVYYFIYVYEPKSADAFKRIPI